MSAYCFISIFGGLMGLILCYGIISINRMKEGMEIRKKNEKIWFKALDLSWRILLPIVFVTILIAPINLLHIYIGETNFVENLISVYIVSFIVSFFVFISLFVKLEKIKVEYNMIKKDELKKITYKPKFTLWFVRLGSIAAASILIFTIYIKQKHSYLLHNNSWLFWILISSIFIIGVINFWILFNRNRKKQH